MKHAVSGRPVRPRRHARRLGRGDPRLVPPRDRDRSPPPVPRRARSSRTSAASNLADQMALLDPDRVDELVQRLPRRTTSRSTPSSSCFDGVLDVLARLKARGPASRNRLRQACDRRSSACLAQRRNGRCSTSSSAPTTPSGTSQSPSRSSRRSSCSTPRPTTPRTSATRRSTCAAARAAGVFARRGRLGQHPPSRGRGRVRRDAGGAAWRPLRRRRAPTSCASSSSATATRTTSSTTPRSRTPSTTGSSTSCSSSSATCPTTRSRPTRRRGVSARRRRTSSGRSSTACRWARSTR